MAAADAPPPQAVADVSNFTDAECQYFNDQIKEYFYPNHDDFKKKANADFEVCSKALFFGLRNWADQSAVTNKLVMLAVASPHGVLWNSVSPQVLPAGVQLSYRWTSPLIRFSDQIAAIIAKAGSGGNSKQTLNVGATAAELLAALQVWWFADPGM